MKENSIVEVKNLWKKYRLQTEPDVTLKKKVINFLSREKNPPPPEVWVLRNINFHVDRGEMLGIIGQNGVGKTTILKLIARIIKPTKGEIEISGTITTLLELGTGFHPELTGRENIFLNGAILGIRKKQLMNVINDIIYFSELEHFIDVPVKFYSSGMYMRLAFSVAAFVDTDIILVDEVLSVGDESFQRKCFRKIHEMKQKGKTIVFVSHNLNAVAELCDRVIWLKSGEIQEVGKPEKVIESYLNSVDSQDKIEIVRSSIRHRWGSKEIEIEDVKLYNGIGEETTTFHTGDSMYIKLKYIAHKKIDDPVFGIAIHRDDGVHIFGTNTKINNFRIDYVNTSGIIECIVNQNLNEGMYLLSVSVYNFDLKHPYDNHNRLYNFKILRSNQPEVHGPVYFPCEWRVIQ